MLPLWGEKSDLPKSLLLDVPYIKQEKVHYSGAACAQMILKNLGRTPPSQDEIMSALGAKDFRGLKHESFEVSLSEVMAKFCQVLPAHYSPAIHIAPKMGDGVAATDFIRGMPQIQHISRHDFYVFKRLMLARNAPIHVRIHFTTDIYPMPDEVAQYLDVTGHCIVIVGYNEQGFIVHDPWDSSAFGGARGGANRIMSYQELHNVTIMVNCSLEDGPTEDRMGVYFEHLQKAVYPNRDIPGRVVVYWPGIEGVCADRWVLGDVFAEFSSDSDITFKDRFVHLENFNLKSGQTKYVDYEINTGNTLGSYQISVKIRARMICPEFPWIKDHKPNRYHHRGKRVVSCFRSIVELVRNLRDE
jgi:hypothetical protein